MQADNLAWDIWTYYTGLNLRYIAWEILKNNTNLIKLAIFSLLAEISSLVEIGSKKSR